MEVENVDTPAVDPSSSSPSEEPSISSTSDSYSDFEIYQKVGTKHKACCTIAHTQLCHQMWANPNNNNQVYYVHEFCVKLFDIITGESKEILKLRFDPQSMCVAEGHLAACGSRGELVIMLLSTYEEMFNAVTSQHIDMNNAVNIGYHRDKLRLAVSSNDNTVKLFSLQTYERVHTLEFNQCMNYSSVSPDGKKFVAVGDCPAVTVFSISEDLEYQRVATVSMSPDWGCCFSSDWDITSTYFAAIQQSPGLVVVWRYPEMEVVARLTPQADSECRAVKFYSPKDSDLNLLLFSERVDQVQVFDVNSGFTKRQILSASQGENGRRTTKIAGFCVSPSYDKLYIGKTNAIYSFEKSQPGTLKEICSKLIIKHPAIFTQEKLTSSLTQDLIEDLDSLRAPPSNAANEEANKDGENKSGNYPRRPFSSQSDEDEELFEEFTHYVSSFRRYNRLLRESLQNNNPSNTTTTNTNTINNNNNTTNTNNNEEDEDYDYDSDLSFDSDGDFDVEPIPAENNNNNNNNNNNYATTTENNPTTDDNTVVNNNNNNNNNFRYNLTQGFSRFILGRDETTIRDMMARLNFEIRMMEPGLMNHHPVLHPPTTTDPAPPIPPDPSDNNEDREENVEINEENPTSNSEINNNSVENNNDNNNDSVISSDDTNTNTTTTTTTTSTTPTPNNDCTSNVNDSE